MAEITMENAEQVFRSAKLTPEEHATIGKTMQLVEDEFVKMAQTIIFNVPRCAHRSAVLRSLLEAKMIAIDAIAKGGLV